MPETIERSHVSAYTSLLASVIASLDFTRDWSMDTRGFLRVLDGISDSEGTRTDDEQLAAAVRELIEELRADVARQLPGLAKIMERDELVHAS